MMLCPISRICSFDTVLSVSEPRAVSSSNLPSVMGVMKWLAHVGLECAERDRNRPDTAAKARCRFTAQYE